MRSRKIRRSVLSAVTAAAMTVALAPAEMRSAPVNAADDYIFHDTFETGEGDWAGRGSAKVASSSAAAYSGNSSLLCSGRAASWNGASKALDTSVFVPGNEYSFSVSVMY